MQKVSKLLCFLLDLNGYDAIRYEKKSLTLTQKMSDQLNLAHVTRKNKKKKKLKQTPVPT